MPVTAHQALCQSDRRHGFTLIELLVVVAIIALLISILVPSLAGARNSAKAAVCKSNLHQLGIANQYYMQDNRDQLAYIRGTKSGDAETTPYYQYDQIFNYWPYIKNMKVYVCPAATDQKSVKAYDKGIQSTGGSTIDGTTIGYYTIRRTDSRYRNNAMRDNWWPDIDPMRYTNDLLTPLYTEFWYNDWQKYATNPVTGEPIPAISGGQLNKIPYPNLAVVMTDAAHQSKANMRHGRGNSFLFVDGHVDPIDRRRSWDRRNVPYLQKQDRDPYGNRCFWAWGLTKEGVDGAGGDASADE